MRAGAESGCTFAACRCTSKRFFLLARKRDVLALQCRSHFAPGFVLGVVLEWCLNGIKHDGTLGVHVPVWLESSCSDVPRGLSPCLGLAPAHCVFFGLASVSLECARVLGLLQVHGAAISLVRVRRFSLFLARQGFRRHDCSGGSSITAFRARAEVCHPRGCFSFAATVPAWASRSCDFFL